MARLLDEYPEVFDAYRALAVSAVDKPKAQKGFRERREESRAARIGRAGRR